LYPRRKDTGTNTLQVFQRLKKMRTKEKKETVRLPYFSKERIQNYPPGKTKKRKRFWRECWGRKKKNGRRAFFREKSIDS